MTPQPAIYQETPNLAFWQALEKYIQGRIVEQVAEGLSLTAIVVDEGFTLTPTTHQRMINRLSKEINPATPSLNQDLLRRIGWHTEQYLSKTGRLPK